MKAFNFREGVVIGALLCANLGFAWTLPDCTPQEAKTAEILAMDSVQIGCVLANHELGLNEPAELGLACHLEQALLPIVRLLVLGQNEGQALVRAARREKAHDLRPD